MSAYFITATGTGTGKTFTTCALLHALPHYRALKPVISGFSGEDTDTHRLIAAMGRGTVEAVSPWRYPAPLAPSMAAEAEGGALPYDALCAWTRAHATGDCFVEGVGGVMVPLDAHRTTRDWMVDAGLPVLLVAGTELGSISHTLAALAALREAGIRPRALVLNESAGSTVPLGATAASLARFTDTLIVPQPRVSSYREAFAIHAWAKELA